MINITEDYASFETAKLLKEKGFDECTLLSYDKNGDNKDALLEDSEMRIAVQNHGEEYYYTKVLEGYIKTL